MTARWIGLAFAVVFFAPLFVVMPVAAGDPAADEPMAPEELAAETGCLECHSVDEDVKGPAYRKVAARYRGDAEARAALVQTVKTGGKGHWTRISRGVPMPPHSRRLSDDQVELLVDWVLSLDEGAKP